MVYIWIIDKLVLCNVLGARVLIMDPRIFGRVNRIHAAHVLYEFPHIEIRDIEISV